MYGVPADLALDPFVGQAFNQICLGRYQIQFHCSGVGSIWVEGEWQLCDPSGEIIDSREDHERRTAYRIHAMIDVRIVRYTIDPPRSIALFFENGLSLRIFDDNPQYESFSLHLDGQPPRYV